MHRREPVGVRCLGRGPQPGADGAQAFVDRARLSPAAEARVGPGDDAGQNSPPRPTEKSVCWLGSPCSMFMKALESTPMTEVTRLGPVPGLNAS